MCSTSFRIALALLLTLIGCRRAQEGETFVLEEPAPAADTIAVEPYWDPGESLTTQDIERGRLEATWREAPSIDSLLASLRSAPSGGIAPPAAAVPRSPDSLDIAVRLPVRGDAPGRSVLAVQILLDRSPFSPGVIDGRWGKNTEAAVFWLQQGAGIEPTGVVDSTTYAWAYDLAGRPPRLLVARTLTADDVAGPFTGLPKDVYARAELDCLCYESLAEKLGERFHATPQLLTQLNRGVDLDSLAAGDSLVVPAIDEALVGLAPSTGPAPPIAAIVISGEGHYLHAVDTTGAVLYHFPTTLGSRYHPSPTGDFRVRSVTHDPWFHYQPALLEGVPDTDRPAKLPPGPNSPVGIVWIDVSVEHYGIHGTSEPSTIGYATSSGCVRLTNWDAEFLAAQVEPGTPVRFRDIEGEERSIASRGSKWPGPPRALTSGRNFRYLPSQTSHNNSDEVSHEALAVAGGEGAAQRTRSRSGGGAAADHRARQARGRDRVPGALRRPHRRQADAR